MRILLVADEESSYLWDYYRPGMLGNIDLILSAGDLKSDYLTFLVTVINRPLLYIQGNHDIQYKSNPPEGCDCIENKVATVNGLRIMGLGGSKLYNGGPNQYTEKQMQRRIARMRLKLAKSKGVDIVLAHAPIKGYGDEDNTAHSGFEAFIPMLDKYRPKYFIHGHVHKRYSANHMREMQYGETKIVNCSGRYIIEL